MDMKVRLRQGREEEEVELEEGASVGEALKKARVNRETVVVRKGGKVVTEEEELSQGDTLELITVISGGM